MNSFLYTVITRTPVWVWLVLIALVALGLRQTRDRSVNLFQVLALPVGMGVWSLISAGLSFGWQFNTLAGWAAAFGLGWLGQQSLLPVQRIQPLTDGRYAVAGSWVPLTLMLTIFAIRYSVSALIAAVPELTTLPLFAIAASALYGLPCGLLAARAQQVWQIRRRTPSAQLHGQMA